MAGFDCFRVICVVTYKPSLHLNSYCAELVQVRKMKIRRRLLDISQGKCLTICVSRVRNRTKLFLSWHPSKCHDMNEDAHFLFCTINFLWGSHCLPACPGRRRSNSRFRQSQVESRSVKTPGYIPKENYFLSPASLVLAICTGSKGLAFCLSFTSFWCGVCFRILVTLLLILGRAKLLLLLEERFGWRPGNQKKVQTNFSK